jgi:hypothetical protein
MSKCITSLFCSFAGAEIALVTSLLLDPASFLFIYSGGPSIAARAAS